MIIFWCLFSGCGKAQTKTINDKTEIKIKQREFQTEATSSVKSEECYICGERNESLMPYYAKRDSVGIIYWNQLQITDSDVREYDDDGNELFEQDCFRIRSCSFGDGYGNISVSGMPNRGITHIKVYYEDIDGVNLKAVSKIVCQKCLDKAVEFYTDQKKTDNDRTIGTTGYCLVDFSTRELYTLSDPYRGYFIRDYYVTYEIIEDIEGTDGHIEIIIFYAPERKKE